MVQNFPKVVKSTKLRFWIQIIRMNSFVLTCLPICEWPISFMGGCVKWALSVNKSKAVLDLFWNLILPYAERFLLNPFPDPPSILFKIGMIWMPSEDPWYTKFGPKSILAKMRKLLNISLIFIFWAAEHSKTLVLK